MFRKFGCEKKFVFDYFFRDLGVNFFLFLRWVVRDGFSCLRLDVFKLGEYGGWVGVVFWGGFVLFFLSVMWD